MSQNTVPSTIYYPKAVPATMMFEVANAFFLPMALHYTAVGKKGMLPVGLCFKNLVH